MIELSDGLTKQLGLQEAQKEPEHDLKKLSAQDLRTCLKSNIFGMIVQKR